MQNVQIFIISVVKICKECLQTQTASASGKVSQTPLGDLRPQNPWAIAPNGKYLQALPLQTHRLSDTKHQLRRSYIVYSSLAPGKVH